MPRYRHESETGPVSAECVQMLAEALEALRYDLESNHALSQARLFGPSPPSP